MIKSKGSFLFNQLILLSLLIGLCASLNGLNAQNQLANPSNLITKIDKIQEQLLNNSPTPIDTSLLIKNVNSLTFELLQVENKQQALSILNDFKPYIGPNLAKSEQLNFQLYTLLASGYQINAYEIKTYLQLAEKSADAEHIEMAYLMLVSYYINEYQIDRAELFLQAANRDLSQIMGEDVSWNRNLMNLSLRLSKDLKTDSIELQLIKTIDQQSFDLFQNWIVERFIRQQTIPAGFLDALKQAVEKSGNKRLQALVYQKTADQIVTDEPEIASQLYLNSINLANEAGAESQLFHKQLLMDWQQIQNASEQKNTTNLFWELVIIGILLSCIILLIIKLNRNEKSSRQRLRQQEIAVDQLSQHISKAENELNKRFKEREIHLKNELIEFSRLDVELKAALSKMEEANYLKNAFMANMSHEIRTPLNGILGFASLLGYELALIDKPELHEYASSIQKSGDKLLHLLNNIIDISRLQANDIEIKKQNCYLLTLVEAALEPLQASAREKGIQIINTVPAEALVQTDHDIFLRVISEILDNSVKYTERGYIKIQTEVHSALNEIEISISDTGIGIDKAYLTHIFEPFRQDNQSYSKQYQGAGLGLPVAKRLIDLLDGKLDISSEKTKGTTHTIRLPHSDNSAETEAIYTKALPAKPKGTAPQNLNILLVEDDKTNLIVLTQLLKKYGKITQAADGGKAIDAILKSIKKDIVFDLVFMDINLPAPWDGIKLMRYIKENHDSYSKIPFVAQTAYGMAGDRERFLNEGFNSYIAKPMRPNDLAVLMESVSGLKSKNESQNAINQQNISKTNYK